MPSLGQRWIDCQTLESLAVKIKRARDRFIQADEKYGDMVWEACKRFDNELELVNWLKREVVSPDEEWWLKGLVDQWRIYKRGQGG